MSTNAQIGYEDPDTNVIRSIYNNFDGYPAHVGKLLCNHYNTLEKVKELVSLGSISSLGSMVSTELPHSYNNPVKDVTVAYHRDRGEPWKDCEPSENNNILDIDQEFIYVFKDGQWYFKGYDKPLTLLCKKHFSLD